ncbi:hypothetical protein E4U57_007121 [Claviceps arundinis]|uniref:Uncharacterized protein n=1 Tax=Claviceps arundinis TaxID=1623583 RepID=A0ABQ7P1A0_9HYPO|nr:hypothetical protein E4U57_007121 [Claviceps arundinis]
MKKWMTKLDIEDDWHLMDAPGQDEGLSPVSIEYELTNYRRDDDDFSQNTTISPIENSERVMDALVYSW